MRRQERMRMALDKTPGDVAAGSTVLGARGAGRTDIKRLCKFYMSKQSFLWRGTASSTRSETAPLGGHFPSPRGLTAALTLYVLFL